MSMLRVLVGLHAGACAELTDGDWIVCGSADSVQPQEVPSDQVICLADWTGEVLHIRVSGDLVSWACGAGAETEPWEWYDARTFGDVVLVIGPADRSWPSDLQLLQTIHRPSTEEKPPSRRRLGTRVDSTVRQFLRGSIAVAVLSLLVAAPSQTSTVRVEPLPRASLTGAEALRAEAAAIIQEEGLRGILVRIEGQDAVVLGLVPSLLEDERARRSFLQLASRGLQLRWQVAPQITDQVRQALAHTGLGIREVSPGHLVVEGVSGDVPRVRRLSEQMLRDLSPGLKAIDLAVAAPHSNARVSASVENGSVRYSVRTDGTKVFGNPH